MLKGPRGRELTTHFTITKENSQIGTWGLFYKRKGVIILEAFLKGVIQRTFLKGVIQGAFLKGGDPSGISERGDQRGLSECGDSRGLSKRSDPQDLSERGGPGGLSERMVQEPFWRWWYVQGACLKVVIPRGPILKGVLGSFLQRIC